MEQETLASRHDWTVDDGGGVAGGWSMTVTTGPAIESVICGNVAITEMLLQSATTVPGDYRLRIFPAVPEDWEDVCFDKLLAVGAFEVSAAQRNDRVQFVEIHSKAGRPCRVEAPFVGEIGAMGARTFSVNQTVDSYGHRVYDVDIRKGETVLLVEKARDAQDTVRFEMFCALPPAYSPQPIPAGS